MQSSVPQMPQWSTRQIREDHKFLCLSMLLQGSRIAIYPLHCSLIGAMPIRDYLLVESTEIICYFNMWAWIGGLFDAFVHPKFWCYFGYRLAKHSSGSKYWFCKEVVFQMTIRTVIQYPYQTLFSTTPKRSSSPHAAGDQTKN